MDTIQLAKYLISCITTEENLSEFNRVVSFIEQYVTQRNPEIIVESFCNKGKTSLLISHGKQRNFRILMSGHLDVVSGDEEQFNPKISQDGKLFGRGAADMKGQVAAMLRVVSERKCPKDVGLLLTTDEELGGENGTKIMVEKYGVSAECAVIPDSESNWTITLEQKGVIVYEIVAIGKSAHSSEPWNGKNAFEYLIEFYLCLRKMIEEKFPLLNKKGAWNLTMNPSCVVAGTVLNQVPERASMTIDFRFPQGIQEKRINETIMQLVRVMKKKYKITVKVLLSAKPVFEDKNNVYVQKVLKIASKRGIKLRFGRESGTSDARFFSKKTSLVMIVPPAGNIHGKEEWISIEDLLIFESILTEFVQK